MLPFRRSGVLLTGIHGAGRDHGLARAGMVGGAADSGAVRGGHR
ncbi:hypothetical protein NSERUTF1_6477 [Nocardia seriolae]|nr:hypothetical protein NSERUTF1_6477 [Nocardia seriolae]